MKVTLLAHTPEPEKLIAAAAKLCYSGKPDVESLMDSLTPESTEKFIDKLVSLGHESPFEHASFTFAIEGVSRAFLAQISRHRHISMSVVSQRFVSMEKFETILPPAIKANDKARILYRAIEADIKKAYKEMQDMGIKNEDARAILMNAQECRMILTANVRTLWHLAYTERMCVRAQTEARSVVTEMIRQCKEVSPVLFKNAGPKCVKGYCPEGSMTCGKAPTMEELKRAWQLYKFDTEMSKVQAK